MATGRTNAQCREAGFFAGRAVFVCNCIAQLWLASTVSATVITGCISCGSPLCFSCSAVEVLAQKRAKVETDSSEVAFCCDQLVAASKFAVERGLDSEVLDALEWVVQRTPAHACLLLARRQLFTLLLPCRSHQSVRGSFVR